MKLCNYYYIIIWMCLKASRSCITEIECKRKKEPKKTTHTCPECEHADRRSNQGDREISSLCCFSFLCPVTSMVSKKINWMMLPSRQSRANSGLLVNYAENAVFVILSLNMGQHSSLVVSTPTLRNKGPRFEPQPGYNLMEFACFPYDCNRFL